MSVSKQYDVKVVVTSCWHGKVDADNLPEAEIAARDAFDDGQLAQCLEEIVHVDVRAAWRTFEVLYAVEQGFKVTVEAACAEDAEASVKKQLSEERAALSGSEQSHFEGLVIEAKEVTP